MTGTAASDDGRTNRDDRGDRADRDDSGRIDGVVWIDGVIRDLDDATIAVTDPGFLLGHGIFETMRAEFDDTHPPRALTRHLARLLRSSKIARVPIPHPIDQLRRATLSIVERVRSTMPVTDRQFIRVRMTITAGGHTVITALPAPVWPATTTLAGVDAPVNEQSPLRGTKTIAHLEETWCRLEAARLGVGEVYRTDTAGRLAEGSASNLFLVRSGKILTPSLDTGCLAGITRGLVMEITDVEERADLEPDDLRHADEAFVTSSTRGVHPVAAIDDRRLDAPGPITTQIAERYRARLESDPDPDP